MAFLSIRLEVSNHAQRGLQEDEQDQVQLPMRAPAEPSSFNDVPVSVYARAFEFLDMRDIANCVVNKHTSEVIKAPSLHREKLKQIDALAWIRLSSLSDMGLQINWRASLKDLLAVRQLSREVVRANFRMQAMQQDQQDIRQRAQDRVDTTIGVIEFGAYVAAFAFCALAKPVNDNRLDISAYSP